VANNLLGHFAQRLRKGRAGVSTVQRSQIEAPTDPEARATHPEGEWAEWRAAILQELTNDLQAELARNRGGQHGQDRVRNLRWAIAIADRQMAVPYERRSLPEVMAEIPALRGVGRGGLQQTLKNLIDDARHRVVARMGSAKEQAMARRLQTRGRRTWGRTRVDESRFSVASPRHQLVKSAVPTPPDGCWPRLGFAEYLLPRSPRLLPPRPRRAWMTRINPFPATQMKLQRLFTPGPVARPAAPPPVTAPRPTPKPIPSPLQAARDGFAGYF
jgi:hypothetical protein